MQNLAIIGGGIAAASAALYTARAKLEPLVFSGPELDQLSLTTIVENYPGFPDGIMGPELVSNATKQAKKFGAKYVEAKVDSITKIEGGYSLTADGQEYSFNIVIVATGASARKLGIPGEDKYFGRGVSTCAVCDAAMYTDKTVVVIGGGDSAMEESLALYKFAKKVYLVHRKGEFRASKIMQDRVLSLKDKIKIVLNSVAEEVVGDGKFVKGVKIKNIETKEEKVIDADGMFLAIGHIPNTSFLKEVVDLDEHGYIITDSKRRTSAEGVFACGDCQDSVFRQAVTSAGSGAEAAIEAERLIEKINAR